MNISKPPLQAAGRAPGSPCPGLRPQDTGQSWAPILSGKIPKQENFLGKKQLCL